MLATIEELLSNSSLDVIKFSGKFTQQITHCDALFSVGKHFLLLCLIVYFL